jgi:hypothetical protein
LHGGSELSGGVVQLAAITVRRADFGFSSMA